MEQVGREPGEVKVCSGEKWNDKRVNEGCTSDSRSKGSEGG